MRVTLTPLSESAAAALVAAHAGQPQAGSQTVVIGWWKDGQGVGYVLDRGVVYRVTVEGDQSSSVSDGYGFGGGSAGGGGAGGGANTNA